MTSPLIEKQQSKIERQDMKDKLLALLLWAGLSPLYAQTTLSEQIKTVIQGNKAQIGVAVLYDGQELVSVNDGTPYAMMSTFKFPHCTGCSRSSGPASSVVGYSCICAEI